MMLSNELKSKSLVRTEILRQQDTFSTFSRLLNCCVDGIIIDNAIEFNFGQLHERENKFAKIFRQYYTSGFGEILLSEISCYTVLQPWSEGECLL